MTNPVTALVGLLRGDSGVAAAVGGVEMYGEMTPAIVGGRMEDALADLMPRRCIVLRRAGGTRNKDDAALMVVRIDIWCYGVSDFDADELMGVVYLALQGKGKRAGVFSTTSSTLPIPGTDPDVGWPFQLWSCDILMQED